MGMIEIPIERREPVMRWIPCSERLPELDDEVLVTEFTKSFLMVERLKCGGMMVDTNTEHCLNDVKKGVE